jgi:Mycothiol maleylpyruvate isomerase N-terminal domain
MSAKQKLLDAEDAGWRELHARLTALADEDWTKPGVVEDWTAKDLLAHVAVWHASTTDRLESLRTTGSLPPHPEVDDFNREQYERNRDLTLHEVQAMSGAARHRFREEVDLLADEPGDQLTQVVNGNSTDHYLEHIPHLDTFLGLS